MISISDVNFGKIPSRQRISGKDSIQTCICPKNPWWNEQFGKISCVEKDFQRKTRSTRYLSQLHFGKDSSTRNDFYKWCQFWKIPSRQRISGKDSIQTCICPKNPWWNEQFGKISCVEKDFQRKTRSTRYLSQLHFGKDSSTRTDFYKWCQFWKIPSRQSISGKDSIQTCICPKKPLWNEQFEKISRVEKEFQRKTFSTRYLSQLRCGKDGIWKNDFSKWCNFGKIPLRQRISGKDSIQTCICPKNPWWNEQFGKISCRKRISEKNFFHEIFVPTAVRKGWSLKKWFFYKWFTAKRSFPIFCTNTLSRKSFSEKNSFVDSICLQCASWEVYCSRNLWKRIFATHDRQK